MVSTEQTVDNEERITFFEELYAFLGLRDLTTVINAVLSIEIRKFFQGISAEMELGMKGHEGTDIFLSLNLVVDQGRHTDLVECIDSTDLQFQLFHV